MTEKPIADIPAGRRHAPCILSPGEMCPVSEQGRLRAMRSAGQRRINMIWEITQALIALTFCAATTVTAFMKIDSEPLTNATFLIVGFYFSRTNHTRVGGASQAGQTGTEQDDYEIDGR